MTRSSAVIRRIVATLALLAGVATPVSAQAFGIPVPGGGIPRGIALNAALGVPNRAAGDGIAALAGVSYGARRIGIAGFVTGQFGQMRVPDDIIGVGGLVSAKVFGGPLVPFSVMLQAGVAYGSADGTERYWHVPAGLAISWIFPRPGVSVKPWVAPRLDWLRSSSTGAGATSVEAAEFGLSGGITFGFLNGLAIDVSYDRVFADPAAASVGLGLTMALP